MKIAIAIVFVILVGLLVVLGSHQEQAMQDCERMYSHDVCFDLLNN